MGELPALNTGYYGFKASDSDMLAVKEFESMKTRNHL